MCRVKPYDGGGILKIRGLGRGDLGKAWGKIYHESGDYVNQETYEWEGSYAYSLIVGGFLLT
jgi:hypothetical protein